MYGATKSGLVQLQKSLVAEARSMNISTGIHLLVPGMALTDLLNAKNKPREVRRVFNILAEKAETMAEYFCPLVRNLDGNSPQQWDYLTVSSVAWRFLTARWRRNRLIDEETGEYITK